MERYDQIMAAVCHDDAERTIYGPLVQKFVLLEQRMEYLEGLPFIEVHPTNPAKQRTTPAHKQYKEYLQQYGNIARILGRIGGADAQDDESPLRAWARERAGRYAEDTEKGPGVLQC